MISIRNVSLVLVAMNALIGCKDDENNAGGGGNGVNDVRKACELRTTWKNPNAEKCVLCQAAAPQPPCGCESFTGFDGVCSKQGDARRAEPSCNDDLDGCVGKCVGDCNCIDACYARAQACKRASAGRDGCVAETCAAYCN